MAKKLIILELTGDLNEKKKSFQGQRIHISSFVGIALFSSLFFFLQWSRFRYKSICFGIFLIFSFVLNIYCSIYYSMNIFRLRCQRIVLLSLFPAITVMPCVELSENRMSAGCTASAKLTAVQNWYRNIFILGNLLNSSYITGIYRAKISFEAYIVPPLATVNEDVWHSIAEINVGYLTNCVNHR